MFWPKLGGTEPHAASVSYLDTVEEALCFGWIDGTAKTHWDDSALPTSPCLSGLGCQHA
jgi:hypothetical protein